MRKLTLSIALAAGIMSAKAYYSQDSIIRVQVGVAKLED